MQLTTAPDRICRRMHILPNLDASHSVGRLKKWLDLSCLSSISVLLPSPPITTPEHAKYHRDAIDKLSGATPPDQPLSDRASRPAAVRRP